MPRSRSSIALAAYYSLSVFSKQRLTSCTVCKTRHSWMTTQFSVWCSRTFFPARDPDVDGRLAPILKRRQTLGPLAVVFGTDGGTFQAKFKSAWESLLLIANDFEPIRTQPGGSLDRKSCGRSICTGTTSDTKALVGCWPRAWTSAPSS